MNDDQFELWNFDAWNLNSELIWKTIAHKITDTFSSPNFVILNSFIPHHKSLKFNTNTQNLNSSVLFLDSVCLGQSNSMTKFEIGLSKVYRIEKQNRNVMICARLGNFDNNFGVSIDGRHKLNEFKFLLEDNMIFEFSKNNMNFPKHFKENVLNKIWCDLILKL